MAWVRLRYRRVAFGSRCDIKPGTFLVATGAEVRFGPGCIVDRGMTLECRGTIDVGAGTVFGHHCTLAAGQQIEIGRDCLIAEMVSIRDHDHAFKADGIPINQQGQRYAPVRLGDNVWLGSKVTVTRGVTIGDNVIVGANAVVTDDLPANCIAGGVPARVVRQRG